MAPTKAISASKRLTAFNSQFDGIHVGSGNGSGEISKGNEQIVRRRAIASHKVVGGALRRREVGIATLIQPKCKHRIQGLPRPLQSASQDPGFCRRRSSRCRLTPSRTVLALESSPSHVHSQDCRQHPLDDAICNSSESRKSARSSTEPEALVSSPKKSRSRPKI